MPIVTSIVFDGKKLIGEMTDLKEQQLPFAMSLAINNTAYELEKAIREGMQQRMTIRRSWVTNGVMVKKSTKRDLVAVVYIDEQRDFLNKFEDGDTKVARGSNIAIPIEARPSKSAVVDSHLRPSALALIPHTTSGGLTQYKGDQRSWLMRLASGQMGIFQRVGKGLSYKILYLLKPSVPTPAILGFAENARRILAPAFQRNFAEAWKRALETARRK
jgi:hypothetical protein